MGMPDKNTSEKIGQPLGPPGEAGKSSVPDLATVRTALETAGIAVWFWDTAADAVIWSGNLEALHGVPISDGSWACLIGTIHKDDRDEVEASLKEALRTCSAYRARYRVPHRDAREDRWIEVSGTPVVENGAVRGMVGLCYEVTERVDLENELRNRARQQEALAQLGERALSEPDLERLLNDAVSTVALTLGVEFVKVLELLPSGAELVLRAGFGWKTDFIGSVLTTTAPGTYARATLDTAAPIVIDDFAHEERFEVPQYIKDHDCVSGMHAVIAGRDGRAYGILGIGSTHKRKFGAQDASFIMAVGNLLAGAIQRRQLETRHELMIRDMRHRSGNLFSQLLALFSQTARTSKNIPDLTSKYQARVLAMANAHRLITEGGWKSIPFMELLYVVLGPYLDRASLNGPNVELDPDPVFNLSAALHELAANAIKHGSLSRSRGQLELTWSVARTERGMTLMLDWVEKNGPPARRPRRTGFGLRLIDLVIVRQLNGEVTRSFTRHGLTVRLIVPLTHERWPTPAATIQRQTAADAGGLQPRA
jgi:PAS domain S-box-containing protein